ARYGWAWEKESAEVIDLPTLLGQAASVSGDVPVFDAEDARFLAPGDMPTRIAQWFGERGIPAPQSRAAMARSIIESLAQAFADALRSASVLSG
ncbi:FGGY-family carbohydrate kinase, partial [Rhizobium johnstonii]|uniref:FGGY-family carbohydrate kinase n=1 Tax=Rhizobium johnstonii TaxID=3019933 RepID=UPI003F9D7C07